jgi:methionine-gamma-lyase
VLDPSSTYSFDDAGRFAEAARVKVGSGYVYARWANPTVDAFEAAVAALEGAEDAEAFSSGMAAIAAVFLGLCRAGDRVVAVRQLYGNTHSLLTDRLPRYGITSSLFDLDDFAGIEDALDGATLLYCETIGNPRIQVADLDRLGDLARGADVPLVVDNTFASPILCRPLEHGATLSLHSATKFIGGHHDLLGGIVCGDAATLEPIKLLGRDIGPTLAPWSAWLALRGLATIAVRVERSCASALDVARFLAGSDEISAVAYPGLDGDASRALAGRFLGGRGGSTLGFDVVGGRARTARFQESLRLVKPAASLGGVHSLLVHAASVTHTQLSPEQLGAAGIGEGYCRLSVGLEDPEDVVADLRQALAASR